MPQARAEWRGDMDDFCERCCATGLPPWDCAGRAGAVGVWHHVYAGEFFPSSDRPELLVSLTLPANASQTETEKQTERLERALAGNRNIDHYSTYIGFGRHPLLSADGCSAG
jgi:multidrug efflux pump subunit AcrB